MRKNVGILVTLAVLVVSGVAGCAATPPQGEPTPAVTVEPTPTAEPIIDPAWPLQLVPTICPELLAQSTVDAIFGEPMQADQLRPELYGRDGIWTAAIRNSGSLECTWGVDVASDNSEETPSVSVIVVPHAAEIAAQISNELDGTVPGAPRVGCDWGYCSSGALIGEYWVDAMIGGTGDPADGVSADMQAAFDAVMTAVAALPPSGLPVLPPQASTWPTRCEDFVSEQVLSDTLGLPGAAFTVGYSYRSSNVNYGAVMIGGGLACGIAREGGGRSGTIVTVPASGDLFAAARDAALLSDEVEAVEIEGLESGSAFVRRNPETPSNASLEMNLHGTWVALSMGTAALDAGDPAALLTDLAEALAAGA